MTAAIAAGRRYLPRGYADFARQVLIWFGFLAAYQVARGVADRDPTRAFANGWRVIGWEQRLAGLGELTLQGWTQSSHFLAGLVSWTYWNSEVTVVGLAALGLVRGHGHGQPFLARRRRRDRSRHDRARDRLPGEAPELHRARAIVAHSRNAMGDDMRESAVLHRVKQGYTTGARSLA